MVYTYNQTLKRSRIMIKIKIEVRIILQIVLFTILVQNNVYSQDILKIKGKIVDEKTNKAIPFANISVCNHAIGLASNEYGEFILKIPHSLKEQNICINVIGYSAYTQKINFFSENLYHTIKLEPKIYGIEEVGIKEKRNRKFRNPDKIIKLALENIENNYPFEPFNLQGYYREYLKHGSANYLNMLEGAVIISDKGFNSNTFPYKARLLQLRYNNDFKIEENFQQAYKNLENENIKYMPNHNLSPFGGNELSILFAHDAIRRHNEVTYSYVYKLNEHFIPNHHFNLDSIIYREDIPVYCISFTYCDNLVLENKEDVQKLDIHGKIKIKSNTYAIERLEYTSYSIKDPGVKLFEVISEYKSHNDKMYLNYLAFSNFFKIPVNSENSNKYNIPSKNRPLQIYDIEVDGNSLILKFNKNLNRFSAISKNNYEFDGFVTKHSDTNHSKSDSIYLLKNPEKVTFINSNTIKLYLPDLKYLLTDNTSGNLNKSYTKSGTNFFLESEGFATIEKNVIKMENINLTINGVKDMDGNEFNESCAIDLYQFREFFVNEIPEKYSNTNYSRMIFNEIPLYKHHPKVVDNFWESFNYPLSAPLQDNFEVQLK